jgi:hypothetical protein
MSRRCDPTLRLTKTGNKLLPRLAALADENDTHFSNLKLSERYSWIAATERLKKSNKNLF